MLKIIENHTLLSLMPLKVKNNLVDLCLSGRNRLTSTYLSLTNVSWEPLLGAVIDNRV